GVEKTGPLPNPKLMVEQAKLEGVKAKISAEQTHWAHELLQEMPKVQAEIELLKAQAAAVIASIGAEKAATQLAAFDTAIKAFEAYHSQISDRIKAITSGAKEDGETQGTSNKGNVRGLADPSGNTGLSPAPGGVAPGSNGAMAGG